MKPLDFDAVASEVQAAMQSAMNNSGELEVQVSDSGASIEIVRIIVDEDGAGFGTKAMLAACQIADSRGASLELSPDGSYYEDEEVAYARLVGFYSRFGFTKTDHGTMLRTAVKGNARRQIVKSRNRSRV